MCSLNLKDFFDYKKVEDYEKIFYLLKNHLLKKIYFDYKKEEYYIDNKKINLNSFKDFDIITGNFMYIKSSFNIYYKNEDENEILNFLGLYI